MLIDPVELKRLRALIADIRTGLLPEHLAPTALHVFFAENPHLLMMDGFEEHMQKPFPKGAARVLSEALLNFAVAFTDHIEHDNVPNLEFRQTSGQWAGCFSLAAQGMLFSFVSRRLLRKIARLHKREELGFNTQTSREYIDLSAEFASGRKVIFDLEHITASIEERIHKPSTSTCLIWSPKVWTPKEQRRQQALFEMSLKPHLDRWKTQGISFEDLNPSEFEDLIGEVLLSSGMKIHKVRQSPQGGRDLIARGQLIPDEEPLEIAVEVKHRKVVDRPEVQLALYQNRAYPALLFATSGRFTAGVFEEKSLDQNRLRLLLRDGLAIGELVRTHFDLNLRSAGSPPRKLWPHHD